MRKLLLLACIAAQVGVLGFMVFDREHLLINGKRIIVATAPIDPRDPFRGDFVRLSYTMNNLLETQYVWSDESYEPRTGDILYAVMKQGPGDLYRASYITNEKPESSTFIKGRYESGYGNGFRNSEIRYGIEQYYVEQGYGLEIEAKRGARNAVQTAMQIELAVNDKGTATIADYTWSPLGIELELIEATQLPVNEQGDEGAPVPDSLTEEQRRQQFSLRLSIQNGSQDSIVLANPHNECAFMLLLITSDDRLDNNLATNPAQPNSTDGSCVNPNNSTGYESTLTLAPEGIYQFDIDLADPRWHVTVAGEEGPITGDLRTLAPNGLFRIIYETPETDASTTDETATRWSGFLRSQRFSGQGFID